MDEGTAVWGIPLTGEKAKQIRSWRVDRQLTWRSLAAVASAEWELNYGSNQLFGQGLCRAAARLLGEDPQGRLWS